MQPLAYAVASMLLIAATYLNGLLVFHLFGGQDFLDFVGTTISVPLVLIVAAAAFSVISYGTKRKAFSTHPILSCIALLNIVLPIGKLVAFFLRAQ